MGSPPKAHAETTWIRLAWVFLIDPACVVRPAWVQLAASVHVTCPLRWLPASSRMVCNRLHGDFVLFWIHERWLAGFEFMRAEMVSIPDSMSWQADFEWGSEF